MSQAELLFELMETEALVNVYFDRPSDKFQAKHPAIIIISSPLGHLPKMPGHKVTLWFGSGILRESYKKISEAYEKGLDLTIRAQAVKSEGVGPIVPRITGRDSKKFSKLLEAMETIKGLERLKEAAANG